MMAALFHRLVQHERQLVFMVQQLERPVSWQMLRCSLILDQGVQKYEDKPPETGHSWLPGMSGSSGCHQDVVSQALAMSAKMLPSFLLAP